MWLLGAHLASRTAWISSLLPAPSSAISAGALWEGWRRRGRGHPRLVVVCGRPEESINSWRTPEFNPPAGQEAAGPDVKAAAEAAGRQQGARRAGQGTGGRLRRAAPRKAPPHRAAAAEGGAAPLGPQHGKQKKKDFQERYRELALFYMEHGHTMVPVACPSGLGGWVAYQRRLWKAGRLPLEHYHSLAALGFQFDAFATRWAARFRQLSEFHSLYGHCTVPADPQTEGRWPGLRQWTLMQRQAWKRGLLDDDRVRRLSGLGFVWQPGEVRWEERFAELQAFKEEHGHCNVPKGWVHNQRLARWVEDVRHKWRTRQGARALSHSREARLKALGFDFEPQRQSWEERYAQLQELAAREGHLSGPFPAHGAWAGLGEWAVQQRYKARMGRLHPDRQRALDALGFVWDPDEHAWAARLAALDALLARVGPEAARKLLGGGRPAARVAAEAAATAGSPSPLGAGQLAQASSAGAPGRASAAAAAAAGAVPSSGSGPHQATPAANGYGALQELARLQELLRWFRATQRQAARGELRPERAAQLAARGLEVLGQAAGSGGDG